jgi:PPK2 family polyphosphate:nucleotide phosphotransferase
MVDDALFTGGMRLSDETNFAKSIGRFMVTPEKRFRLKDFDTGWACPEKMKKMGEEEAKKAARDILEDSIKDLAEMQELLWANGTRAILVILQGMDAAGKDGTIKHVMSGMNPQGCEVTGFKQPSETELHHDFLWRYCAALPEKGRIGIFNRSYYEEVLVVRVHPEWIEKQKLANSGKLKDLWKERFEQINCFEEHLARSGTVVLKFFLNVSRKEQGKRLLDRLDDPHKNWKFAPGDIAERDFWDEYMDAYEDALSATSTEHAPWYVVPADHKWVARAMVAKVLSSTIDGLKLDFPKMSEEVKEDLEAAKVLLKKQK